MLLKDVFDYSLEEIAELVDSTVGGVKAALNRGRLKLAEQPVNNFPQCLRPRSDENTALLQLYVERFNLRDWAGLRELIAADARLLVVDRYSGRVGESPDFGTDDCIPSWRLSVAEVDGDTVVIIDHADDHGREPRYACAFRTAASSTLSTIGSAPGCSRRPTRSSRTGPFCRPEPRHAYLVQRRLRTTR